MKIKKIIKNSTFIKIIAAENVKEVGHAYLYLIYNDLHKKPYGLLEDIFVDEKFRGRGIGTKILQAVISEAKKRKCYKLVGTSRKLRVKVHQWYARWGFKKCGYEFRMDLK